MNPRWVVIGIEGVHKCTTLPGPEILLASQLPGVRFTAPILLCVSELLRTALRWPIVPLEGFGGLAYSGIGQFGALFRAAR